MSGHLAIILPGGNAGVWTAPVLLPTLAVEQAGAVIERVSYAGPLPQDLSLEESKAFNDAVAHQVTQLLDSHRPDKVSFVAKSRGALFLAALEKTVVPEDADAIWVTPLLGLDYMRAGLVDKGWRSLVVAGSADPYHDGVAHARVCEAIGAQSLVIEGANHGLVIESDVLATVDAYRALAAASVVFACRNG